VKPHGWGIKAAPGVSEKLIAFIRPAIQAVPSALAARLGHCQIILLPCFDDPERVSQWREIGQTLEITVAAADTGRHDVALELLVCLGQALWDKITTEERDNYWKLLEAEISSGGEGEIDDDALRAKRLLLASRASARSSRRLEAYGRASFAASAAEYIHCLWHDVTIREGPEHLPARRLVRRLQLLARWFPPNPGYRLLAKVSKS
jgi:hypothetical protein